MSGGVEQVRRTTPLHDVHLRLGAHLTEFAGWQMPLRYTSDVAEHHAVRTAVGIFDLSHMGEIEVTGPDAAAALDFALVGWPSAMAVGKARYTLICNSSGGIVDDLVVFRLAQERFLVVANAVNTATVVQELTARTGQRRAAVRDVTAEWALVAVQGPRAQDVLFGATATDPGGLTYYTTMETELLGHRVLLSRTGYTGEDGFEIYCRPDAAVAIWDGLMRVGARHGLTPAGLAARDTLRLEAGMPLYGHELGIDVTPYEVGLGRLVSSAKDGAFVGDTALAAADQEGPRRRLVGLVGEGRRSPRAGYPVIDPSTGHHIGVVTSGAPSPTLGHPAAMAFVAVGFEEPGTELLVDVRGSREPVEVTALPFYRRNTN